MLYQRIFYSLEIDSDHKREIFSILAIKYYYPFVLIKLNIFRGDFPTGGLSYFMWCQ